MSKQMLAQEAINKIILILLKYLALGNKIVELPCSSKLGKRQEKT